MATRPYVRTATLTQQNPIVDTNGRPTPALMTLINSNIANLANAVNALAELPLIKQAIAQAQATAEEALQSGNSAQADVETLKREAALSGSYIAPSSVLTANSTNIAIVDHTRYYADGTSVSVTGEIVSTTTIGDTDYVSYIDVDRSGGLVSYEVSTTQPIQTGNRHVVGAIMVPTVEQGTVDGGDGPLPPGQVYPKPIEGGA